jgi:hypothetical protein
MPSGKWMLESEPQGEVHTGGLEIEVSKQMYLRLRVQMPQESIQLSKLCQVFA